MNDTSITQDDLFQRAVAHQQVGALAQAEPLYRQFLARDPGHADARHNLGILLLAQGHAAEAGPELALALRGRPDEAPFWLDYIDGLKQAGRLEAAWQVLIQAKTLGLRGPALERLEQETARLRPEGPPLGMEVLFAAKRFEEIEAIASCLTLQHPDNASVWGVLGAALRGLSRRNEALAAMTRAIELKPDDAQFSYNLSVGLSDLRQFEEAEVHLRKILAAHPDHRPALARLAGVLIDLRRPREAQPLFERLIAADPSDTDILNDFGACQVLLDRLDEAEAVFKRVIALTPCDAQAHCHLGTLRMMQDRLAEAEALYRKALELNPRLVEAQANLSEVFRASGRLVDAEESCIRALELDPGLPTAHQLRGVLSAYLSDHSRTVEESDLAMALAAPTYPAWEARIYSFSYHPDLPAETIYREFVRWGDRFPDPTTDFSGHDRTPRRRLRVGYVSPDFRKHTSRFYFLPLMANRDPEAVELFAYSNVLLRDEHTETFKACFDHWREIRTLSDPETAALIREDRIDILVDCCNHMRDDRLAVFALKPAPIQVTWLGAAWTTGLKAVDYVLFDQHIAPEGTLARETIVRLPGCFIAYRPPEATAPTAPPPALETGRLTFGYTGRTERLNHHTFRVWGEILRRVPTARLILDYTHFADPRTQAHYRELMARHGLDPARVEMRRSLDIFEGLNDIDILLDSFPHSGGTMLFDALWMGVPALTLKSRPPLGRIGTTLMMNLGMPEWVAETEADYIDKAVAFAGDLEGLASVRAGLRERMRSSPLMDEVGFARNVEAAYRRMWGDRIAA